jgi:hypothetical protein
VKYFWAGRKTLNNQSINQYFWNFSEKHIIIYFVKISIDDQRKEIITLIMEQIFSHIKFKDPNILVDNNKNKNR